MKKSIKFLKAYGRYNPGESAGFEPHVCDALVGDGLAEYLTNESPTPVTPESLAPTRVMTPATIASLTHPPMVREAEDVAPDVAPLAGGEEE